MIHHQPIRPLDISLYSEAVDTTGRLKTMMTQLGDPALSKAVFEWYLTQPGWQDRLIQGVTGLPGITMSLVKGEQPQNEIGYIDWETDQQKGVLGNVAVNLFKGRYFSDNKGARNQFLSFKPTASTPHVSRFQDLMQLIQAYDMQRYKLPPEAVKKSSVQLLKIAGTRGGGPLDIKFQPYHTKLINGLISTLGNSIVDQLFQHLKLTINTGFTVRGSSPLYKDRVESEHQRPSIEKALDDTAPDEAASILLTLYDHLPIVKESWEDIKRKVDDVWYNYLSPDNMDRPLPVAIKDYIKRLKGKDDETANQIAYWVTQHIKKRDDWKDVLIKVYEISTARRGSAKDSKRDFQEYTTGDARLSLFSTRGQRWIASELKQYYNSISDDDKDLFSDELGWKHGDKSVKAIRSIEHENRIEASAANDRFNVDDFITYLIDSDEDVVTKVVVKEGIADIADSILDPYTKMYSSSDIIKVINSQPDRSKRRDIISKVLIGIKKNNKFNDTINKLLNEYEIGSVLQTIDRDTYIQATDDDTTKGTEYRFPKKLMLAKNLKWYTSGDVLKTQLQRSIGSNQFNPNWFVLVKFNDKMPAGGPIAREIVGTVMDWDDNTSTYIVHIWPYEDPNDPYKLHIPLEDLKRVFTIKDGDHASTIDNRKNITFSENVKYTSMYLDLI